MRSLTFYASACGILLLCIGGAEVERAVPNEQLLVLSSYSEGGTSSSPSVAAIFIAGQYGGRDHVYPFAHGVQTSPGCSSNQRSGRCLQLHTVSEDWRVGGVVLASLRDAVGLMELRYDGNDLLHVSSHTLSITELSQVTSCVPLDIISFDGRLIVLCLNELTLRSCDIHINRTHLSESTLTHCQRLHNFEGEVSPSNISNFVPYEETEQMVFVAEGVFYGIRFDRRDVQTYSSLNEPGCNHIEYASNDVFYARCRSGRAVSYDADLRQALPPPSPLVVPYACPPSGETTIRVLQDEKSQGTTTLERGGQVFNTTGENFIFGVCYNSSIFFLLDSVIGVTVFRDGDFQHIGNSPQGTGSVLTVFGGPRLVLISETDDSPEVVVYDSSFSPIIEWTSGGRPMAVSVLANLTTTRSEVTTTTSTTTTTTSLTPKPPRNMVANLGVKAGIPSAIIIIIIMAAIISVLVLICKFRGRLRCKSGQSSSGRESLRPNGSDDGSITFKEVEGRAEDSDQGELEKDGNLNQLQETPPLSNHQYPMLELHKTSQESELSSNIFTPVQIDSQRNNNNEIVPHRTPLSPTSLSPHQVCSNYNERRNTEEKKNDEQNKSNMFQR